MAVVWAVMKERLFLAGAEFELIVDHRLLIPILNSKTLDELATPYLIHLKEKFAPFSLNAVRRAGVDHKVVDCFSRNPTEDASLDDQEGESEIEDYRQVMFLAAALDHDSGEEILGNDHLVRFKDAGKEYPEYYALIEAVDGGFPPQKQQAGQLLCPYWDQRHQLTVEGGLVLLGSRIVNTKLLKKEFFGISSRSSSRSGTRSTQGQTSGVLATHE